ncbi:MAG: hydantoinase/oxoprolinase family protein, partial [Xanthobacteraceae bacterium]
MNVPESILGVDIGGTFTDFFLFNAQTQTFRTAKTPSHRGAEAAGFLGGLAALGNETARVTIVHGTTVGTNALLERKGARIGVITTPGFRDVLEMRRRDRPRTWGLWGDFVPIADRDMRIEVPERTLADGTIRERVDIASVESAARTLLEKGAESVAIIFINAHANAENEALAAKALRALWPNPNVVASHEVLPEIREFERASTTALNAYLQPVIGGYLSAIETGLSAAGATSDLLIVQSNGGIMSARTARWLPVRTALSGPAAGVIAAAAIATNAGYSDIITADLGGTSFDVSLVTGSRPSLAAQTTVDFGLVIRTPMIEIATIGAGGGSIAKVDRTGMLQVGPESAGSIPGPVCYNQGNQRPTLTDAHVVLGRIDSEAPIGGKQTRLDRAAAREAVLAHVGKPLGLDVMRAAEAIVRVAEARMAGAIRLISIERGHDPTRFALLPFGGGGALHVCAMIRDVGLSRALVPPLPGINSAIGCAIADLRHDRVLTLNLLLDKLDVKALQSVIERERAEALSVVREAGIAESQCETRVEFDMQFVGQTHAISVPIADGPVTRETIRAAFEDTYKATFSRLLPSPVKLVNVRTAGIGRRPRFDFSVLAPSCNAKLENARRKNRKIWFNDAEHDTLVWSRVDLPVGTKIEGPAVLEQP